MQVLFIWSRKYVHTLYWMCEYFSMPLKQSPPPPTAIRCLQIPMLFVFVFVNQWTQLCVCPGVLISPLLAESETSYVSLQQSAAESMLSAHSPARPRTHAALHVHQFCAVQNHSPARATCSVNTKTYKRCDHADLLCWKDYQNKQGQPDSCLTKPVVEWAV